MGWLSSDEQRKVKKKYKMLSFYWCDGCQRPIKAGTLFVIDSKKGYYPWPKNYPDDAKCLSAREPKVTYHLECDPNNKRLSKRNIYELICRLADRIVHRISKKKRRGYWTTERLHQHYEDRFPDKVIRKAIKLLRKEKKIKKRKGGYVCQVKKT